MLTIKAYRKAYVNVIICHTSFSQCHGRTLKINMYYKTHSDILGKLLICGICAIISNTALFCVTSSQSYDFCELSIFPVKSVIIKTRNMD